MKCPKCGYHSFEYLENCRKCGQDLAEHKSRFNLGGFLSPPPTEAAPFEAESTTSAAEPAVENGDIDFGFDFLDEEEPAEDSADNAELGGEEIGKERLDISQPFDVDGESVPADELPERQQKRKDAESDFEF
ncbi:MAG TPA: hypothetical protein VJ910_09560 [Desulfuromonadales bacterium]|nr:hypothetical protein [Desulfuromonadales bacterium]